MLMCYGKNVFSVEVVQDKWGNQRALVQYSQNGKQHNVSCEAISWVSTDWYKQ